MKKILLSLSIILLSSVATFSQSTATESGNGSIAVNNDFGLPKKNNVKLSLTSLVFKNFQLQYERSLTKRIGVVMGYSFIPKGGLPFQSQIEDLTSGDSESKDMFTNAALGYTAFTPEVRFYLGKGYGKGFYIAPFYRHIKYDISNVNFTYNSDFGAKEDIDMGGKILANTFGVQFGAQFNLGKNLILDWWIVGPHYGTSKGDLVGTTSRLLTPNEQAALQRELDDVELPLSDVKVEVNATGAKINISGPWGGIRSGVSLGYRF